MKPCRSTAPGSGRQRPASLRMLGPAIVFLAVLGAAMPSVSASESTSPGVSPPGRRSESDQYRPPVDAVVIDPFRPPDQPWLSGNRGLEYDTSPGTAVGAIGPGLVVFAGPVAGQLYVTVLHPDGIRSSYSYLAAISVVQGDRVRSSQTVGITSALPVHLGARIGSAYIDPASLFGSWTGQASVFLVPLSGGTPSRALPRGSIGPPVTGVPGAVPDTADAAVGARIEVGLEVVHGLAASVARSLAAVA